MVQKEVKGFSIVHFSSFFFCLQKKITVWINGSSALSDILLYCCINIEDRGILK